MDETLGQRINRLRLEHGLSQEALAKQIGRRTNKSMISRWESDTDKPRIDNLQDLARVFGISLNELATGEVSNGKKDIIDGIVLCSECRHFRETSVTIKFGSHDTCCGMVPFCMRTGEPEQIPDWCDWCSAGKKKEV